MTEKAATNVPPREAIIVTNEANSVVAKQDSLCTTPRKPESTGSGAVSPNDGNNPFGAFPLQNLTPHHSGGGHGGGAGRRASSVSFNTEQAAEVSKATQGQRGDVSPPTAHPLAPLGQPAHTTHSTKNNPYRTARDAFYHHFEASDSKSPQKPVTGPESPTKGIIRDATGAATEVVRCHQLASAALAFSYLLADLEQSKGKFPNLRVTFEDIITKLKLPISYLSHNHFTFHELNAIISAYIRVDKRFEEYEVIATAFDTKQAEGAVAMTLIEEETARRTSALSATELRSTISDDGLTFDRVKVACFDFETVTAENVIELDASDLEKDDLLSNVIPDGMRAVGDTNSKDERRRRPGTRSGCAIIADIHRTMNSVQLLSMVSVEPLKVKRVDVPLKTLHDAMSTRNPSSQRAQGIIEIRRKGSVVDKSAEGTMGISLGVAGDVLARMLTPSVEEKRAGAAATTMHNIFGYHWTNNVAWKDVRTCPLEFYDYTIANHLLCTATALHLLNATRFPSIDVNTIVDELKLPASQVVVGRTMHCQQWYAMLQHLALSRKLLVEYVPFARQVKKRGAAPYISVGALAALIQNVVAQTPADGDSRRILMMVCFNGNKARQSLNYVSHGENPINYAIVAGFDEETQCVLLLDCDIKRNELHWACTMDNLHAAVTDYGCLLLADSAVADASESLASILPELDTFTAATRNVPPYVPTSLLTLGAAEGLVNGTPLALCALAAARCDPQAAITLENFWGVLPCNISHAFFPFISLFDLARLFNCLSASSKLGLHASVVCLSPDRAMHRKIGQSAFAAKLKGLLDEGHQVLVYYSRFLLQAPAIGEDMLCPNYALVLGMPNADTVVLADANPLHENSKFQVPVNDLFKACEDVCQVSRRPKGLLCISKDADACNALRRFQAPFGSLYLRTLSSHAFRAVGSPQLQAVAMAFTAFGFPARASEVFYCAAEHGDEAMTAVLLPMSGLRRRMTVDVLAAVANLYATKVLDGKVAVKPLGGSSRSGHVTREDAQTALSKPLPATAVDPTSCDTEILVCVYDVRNAYDVPLEFVSAGIVAGLDKESNQVVVVDAEPSSWGEFWCAPIATAVECIVREPDDADARFGLLTFKRVNGATTTATPAAIPDAPAAVATEPVTANADRPPK